MRLFLTILFAVLAFLGGLIWLVADRIHLLEANAFLRERTEVLADDNARLVENLEAARAAERLRRDLPIRREIEEEVESIRGLEFLHPVDYNEIDRDEIRQVVLSAIEQQATDEELENFQRALSAMGFIPHDLDLKETITSLLTEQIAAFYDQHTHKLYMLRGADLARADNRIILAHELVHALQDQHFNLKEMPLDLKDNDDRVAAAQALIEGDATLVMNLYMMNNLTGQSLGETLAMAFTQPIEKLLAAPRYLRDTLVFPYIEGEQFATALYERGGFEVIDRAFREPPVSTAQIYRPEKFLDNPRVEPVPIEWEATSLEDEEPMLANTVGELGLRTLFKTWIGGKESETIGSGWAGDRCLVFASADGDGADYVWQIAWASAADCEEYLAGLRKLLISRYKLEPQKLSEEMPSDGKIFAFDHPRAVRVMRISDNLTAIAQASRPERAEALLGLSAR